MRRGVFVVPLPIFGEGRRSCASWGGEYLVGERCPMASDGYVWRVRIMPLTSSPSGLLWTLMGKGDEVNRLPPMETDSSLASGLNMLRHINSLSRPTLPV